MFSNYSVRSYLFTAFLTAIGSISCISAFQFPVSAAVLNVPSTQYPTIQSAVNAANLGDTIIVEAGRVYTENIILRYKSSGSGYITIQSSALANLPAPGNRVSPADAVHMPKIQTSGNVPVFATTSGTTPSRFYKLIGLEITRTSGAGTVSSLIELGTYGSSQNSLAEIPTNFVIDRCYIHGLSSGSPTNRGVKLEADNVEITNSYIADMWNTGQDTQAILSTNCQGGHLIANNFLEAAGENVMYGGGDPWVTNMVMSNIVIEHNHFYKPLSWRGQGRGVKNLFELKNAKDVTVRNNIFENNWGEAQAGHAIVFTPANQDGTAPWTTVENVLFEYNIVKNVGSAFTLMMEDYASPSRTMRNVHINHNLLIVAGSSMSGHGNINMLDGGADGAGPGQDIGFNHNTFIHTGSGVNRLQFEDPIQGFVAGFTFDNNIIAAVAGSFAGVMWSSTSGTGALNGACNGWSFNKNVIQRSSSGHPTTSFYVSSVSGIGFVDPSSGNFELSSTSPYRNAATDGKDIGADIRTLNQRTACVQSGIRSNCASAASRYDFDGDSRADISVFRPSEANWYLNQSSAGSSVVRFGIASDMVAPADFDGDGKADITVFRPADNRWYVLNSSTGNVSVVYFGRTGDIPVPADYDGDGMDDIAVWRPSNGTWYRLNSSDGGFYQYPFGLNGDRAAAGDYDGDGNADLAVFRPATGTWYLLQSTAGFSVLPFGVSTDIVVPADYDGDGRTDIAVFRPSTGVWYRLNSSNGQVSISHFGMNGDIPSPGDFDGDGQADISIFRPSTGTWYLNRSTEGITTVQYGMSGDLPVPAAFVF